MVTPMKCDLCKIVIDGPYIDGKTVHGSWAYMCIYCYRLYGVGLGTGRGQLYFGGRKVTGQWGS